MGLILLTSDWAIVSKSGYFIGSFSSPKSSLILLVIGSIDFRKIWAFFILIQSIILSFVSSYLSFNKSGLHVKRILGHKSIMTTQRYVELYEEIYSDQPLNYTCEIALNVFEAKRLAEQGFQFVTGEYNDGGKLFRKVFQNSEVIS